MTDTFIHYIIIIMPVMFQALLCQLDTFLVFTNKVYQHPQDQHSLCEHSLQRARIFPGYSILGFPGDSEGKASACNAGDPGSIPGSGRSPGEGDGNPLQYSRLENSMDGETWWATVHSLQSYYKESDTTEQRHFLSPFFSLYLSREVLGFDPIYKMMAMATHSSTLAQKIPWMERPGGLQSMGSLGVGHD